MLNYSMIYSVSEVARLLEVNGDTIKKWSYTFLEHLSSKANPGKGKARQFMISDIRVFSYILLYWEDEPDLENIRYGLCSNSHFEYESINHFITGITPLFRIMPDDIDETWRGTVFGGEFELGDIFSTAESFKLASDELVTIAYKNSQERELLQPVLYNYRHATELYIKAIVGEEISHSLIHLMQKLEQLLKTEFNAVPAEWFKNIVEAFDNTDPKGTAFRYGITVPVDELYVDMIHIKNLMEWVSQSFKQIKIEMNKRQLIT